MKIEFLGLPASGKSKLEKDINKYRCFFNRESIEFISYEKWLQTIPPKTIKIKIMQKLFKLIPRYFKKIIVQNANSHYKYYKISEFILDHPELDQKLLADINTIFSENKTLAVEMYKMMQMTYYYQQIQSEYFKGKNVIFHEGFAQRIISLYLFHESETKIESNKKKINEFIELIAPFIDILIYIETKPQTSYERMKLRQRFPRDLANMNKEKALKILKNIDYNCQAVLKLLEKKGIKIIRISGKDKPLKTSRKIIKILEELNLEI